MTDRNRHNLLDRARRVRERWPVAHAPVHLGMPELVATGGGGGGATPAVVTGHGDPWAPDPEHPENDPPGAEAGRIYEHRAAIISGSPPFGLTYARSSLAFYSLQPHGWFHPGAIVELVQVGGAWVAACRAFYGLVSKRAPVGTSVAQGLVEVVPFDGNPGLAYSSPGSLTQFSNSPVYRVATFPGSELFAGEPVLCLYVGAGGIAPVNHDADWVAINMPNLFGDPSDGDYANAPPPPASLCVVSDPDLPVATPTDDAFTSDDPAIAEAPEPE